MQRPVDAFPEEDIVDVTVALKQLHSRRFARMARVHLLRSAGRRAVDTKDPDIEPALRLPLLKNLQHIGVAARNADRGEARSIHVLDQGPAAGLQLIRRYLGKSGRQPGEWLRCRPGSRPWAFRAASRRIDPLTKSGGSGAFASIPKACKARLFRKT